MLEYFTTFLRIKYDKIVIIKIKFKCLKLTNQVSNEMSCNELLCNEMSVSHNLLYKEISGGDNLLYKEISGG